MTLVQNLMIAFMLLTPPPAGENPTFVVTIPPLAMLVQEIGEGRAQVHTLLPPGASPHTYEPRPSDARAAQNARALFFVSRSLDGWGASLTTSRTVEVLPLLPAAKLRHLSPATEHDAHGHHHHDHDPSGACVHTGIDAHVWMDPILARDVVKALTDSMCEADPEGCAAYRRNADALSQSLGTLDEEIRRMLEPVRGRTVVLMHAFLDYYLNRYGFPPALLVAPVSGKEPTPKALRHTIEQMRTRKAKAVFAELQMSDRAAKAVAESAGVRLLVLDPMGGGEGTRTYRDLLLTNTRTLVEGLRD